MALTVSVQTARGFAFSDGDTVKFDHQRARMFVTALAPVQGDGHARPSV